jgi:hypothetical protein
MVVGAVVVLFVRDPVRQLLRAFQAHTACFNGLQGSCLTATPERENSRKDAGGQRARIE